MGKFDGFEQEKRGPWKNGNYNGCIVPEYETTGNFAAIHKTEDKPSQDGKSRNLKLCVTVVDGNLTKSMSYFVNYRPDVLSDERIAEIRKLMVQYKGQQKWPDADAQRDFLTLTRFHELERAGIPVELNGSGLDVGKMVGQTAKFKVNTQRKNADGKIETVPGGLLSDKNTTDEEKSKWFNGISGIAGPAE